MDLYLQPQLKNSTEIKSILKEVELSWTLADGRAIKTLMVYLPISNGVSVHQEFFEKIKEGILSNFVFECSEIEKKLGVKNKQSSQKLFEKATRKLSKHTAQGELGELILFTLLDVYFNAPKILSKISMKTSRRMPVYGADAVHGQFLNGQFILYLGESKLHQNFNGAATDAAKSIKKAKDKYVEEFDLLDSRMDFPNIDDTLKDKILDLLDPFSENDLSDVIHSPCFIGFSEPEMIADASSEEDFIKRYKVLAQSHITKFFTETDKQEINIHETALLMLPFSCIDTLVTEFIEYMEIAK